MCLTINIKACAEYFAVEMAQENARELSKDWKTHLLWMEVLLMAWLEVD